MKTIGVREFLRGAYKDLDEPTVIMSHSRPLGVWTPSNDQLYSFESRGDTTIETFGGSYTLTSSTMPKTFSTSIPLKGWNLSRKKK